MIKIIKIAKKIGKNTIVNKKMLERSSDEPGNYPNVCFDKDVG